MSGCIKVGRLEAALVGSVSISIFAFECCAEHCWWCRLWQLEHILCCATRPAWPLWDVLHVSVTWQPAPRCSEIPDTNPLVPICSPKVEDSWQIKYFGSQHSSRSWGKRLRLASCCRNVVLFCSAWSRGHFLLFTWLNFWVEKLITS